jgi:hypothetical protein
MGSCSDSTFHSRLTGSILNDGTQHPGLHDFIPHDGIEERDGRSQNCAPMTSVASSVRAKIARRLCRYSSKFVVSTRAESWAAAAAGRAVAGSGQWLPAGPTHLRPRARRRPICRRGEPLAT